ncbi:MAG: hypothetical protein GX367_05935 [Bacteroidales bacterium]|nr:hypothetical protein [Bacteroidales bacterium]
MKPLFPSYCRAMGYVVLAITLLGPFVLYFMGMITDSNLLVVKESFKLIGMVGALLILFAYTADEDENTSEIRSKATRNAIFLMVLFLFLGMVYRIFKHDVSDTEGPSFLIFLILNVLCLEFSIKKSKIDKIYKR